MKRNELRHGHQARWQERVSRVPRSEEQARATYDRLSRWYDLAEWPFERTSIQMGLDMLDAHAHERVLEIGFGSGHGVVALARAVGDAGRVYGIDLSPGMCAVAQARATRAGVAGRVDLICGSATTLPYPDNTFDAVFMSFTLELFDTPDITIVLAECYRVLRNGGRIAIVSLAQRDAPTLPQRVYEWAHRAFPAVVDCRPIYVGGALEEVGFHIAAQRDHSLWGLPVTSVVATK